jgi:DNA-binding NarL/FixJ family response regulator
MTGSDPEGQADPRPIRVFVVDDHAVVRRGMQVYLEMIDDVELVGEAASGQQALDRILALAAAGQPPDVVMMDLVMPGLDGIATTAALKERRPDVEVVAMTSFSEGERVHGALQAGAAGYLLKDA